MNYKLFTTAFALRWALFLLATTHLAPDSKMFLSLSENFDYSHSLLYPMVLKVFGVTSTLILQIVLDSLTAVMLGSIVPMAGWLYCFSLGPIVYSNYILTDTLATFFLTVTLFWCLKAKGGER